jgi:DNA replication protein DnaC
MTTADRERQQQEGIRKSNEETGLKLIHRYVPTRYRQAETDNQVALDWIKDPEGVLYLYGPTGTGKTHTSWAIIREYLKAIPPSNRYSFLEGGSVTALLEPMKPGQVSDHERGSCLDPKEKAAKGHLLFLDDIGASKITDWALDMLFYVLDTRYNEMLPTIVASNLMPGAELTDLVGDRIVSRLAEENTLIKLVGEDRRRSS